MSAASDPAFCPTCGEEAVRVYTPLPDTWHCEGSHRGDYGTGNHTGTKADALNRAWSAYYGEPPPPPDTSGPRNKTGISQR